MCGKEMGVEGSNSAGRSGGVLAVGYSRVVMKGGGWGGFWSLSSLGVEGVLIGGMVSEASLGLESRIVIPGRVSNGDSPSASLS